MKTRICHTWERSDPSIEFVDEAVNRLANFKDPTADEAALKAVNKVTNNCDFELNDVLATNAYLELLAVRATEKWKEGTELHTKMPEMAASILQAAQNARDAAQRLFSLYSSLSTV